MSVAVGRLPGARAPERDRIAQLAELILLFRLAALNVTLFELVGDPDRAPVVGGIFVFLALVVYGQLRAWSRGRPVVRDPRLLAGDCVLSMGLLAYLGSQSPYFLSTIGLALIGGAVHGRRGAIACSLFLTVTYYGVLLGSEAPSSGDFAAFVTLPLLYPTAALGAAAMRRLLDQQARTLDELRSTQLAAVAGEERTRVAREMHDSLGKTLYGIALQATSLAKRVERDAPPASAAARRLAGAAQVAAGQARELIGDLRSDALELPLADALAAHVERWSRETGIAAGVRGGLVDLPHPGTRYELFSIVKEALRNVDQHAEAHRVEVVLDQVGGEVVLLVADDGVGLGASGAPGDLEPDGHYGLIGMSERAERIGASVWMTTPPAGGTRVEVRLSAGDVRTPEPWATGAGYVG